jgi:hypothetical protein
MRSCTTSRKFKETENITIQDFEILFRKSHGASALLSKVRWLILVRSAQIIPRLGWLDAGYPAFDHRIDRSRPQGLAVQTALAKKLSFVEYGDDRFLALLRCDSDLHAPLLNEGDRVRDLTLNVNALITQVFRRGFSSVIFCQQLVAIALIWPRFRLRFLHGASPGGGSTTLSVTDGAEFGAVIGHHLMFGADIEVNIDHFQT